MNTATVSSTATDPDLTNNSATATTGDRPLFTINVEITKAGPASVTPGSDLVYAITATNNGTLDATDVEDGSYGYCVETGEEIGIKRLEARPVATLCIEAQERRERREKQYGDRDDRYR